MVTRYFPLDNYEFVLVCGEDALTFLQGQISCNTELLTEQLSLTGVLCNLKGRVIADFRLLKRQDDCILQCAEGMAEAIVATLSKYAVFSKVEISILKLANEQPREGSLSITPVGLIGDIVERGLKLLAVDLPLAEGGLVHTENFSVITLPSLGQRIEVWFYGIEARNKFLLSLEAQASNTMDLWLREDIAAGIYHVSPTTSKEFTPQLLNYDISGLIDFTKGCYTGQEIVARMFYRGTAKKRLYLLESSYSINEGSRVLSGTETTESSKGGVILAYNNSIGEAPLLLAILPSENIQSALPLRLSDQADSVLNVQKLPYSEGVPVTV